MRAFSFRALAFVIALFVVVLSAACPKESAVSPAVSHKAASGTDIGPVEAPPPVPPAIPGAMGEVFDAYDRIQIALAKDTLESLPAVASALVDATTRAMAGVFAAHKGPLSEVGTAAGKLRDTLTAAEPQIDAVRLVFGDVSKALIALAGTDPTLQTGRFLFQCPMAPGYQRWVQTNAALRNPYFGKKMLECGEAVSTWGV